MWEQGVPAINDNALYRLTAPPPSRVLEGVPWISYTPPAVAEEKVEEYQVLAKTLMAVAQDHITQLSLWQRQETLTRMDLSSELNKVLETYRQMLPAAAVKAVERTPERVTRSPRGGGAPEGTAPKPPKEMGPGTSAFATPAVQRPQPPAKTPVVIPMEEDVPDQPEEREKAPGRTPFGKIKLRFPQPTFGPGFRPPAKAPSAWSCSSRRQTWTRCSLPWAVAG